MTGCGDGARAGMATSLGTTGELTPGGRKRTMSFVIATVDFLLGLRISGTVGTGGLTNRGMRGGVASLMIGDLATGERTGTLASIFAASTFRQPCNQGLTRCAASPLSTDADTASVHSRGGRVLRRNHALSCFQEPGLRIRQSTGACSPSLSVAVDQTAGRSLLHHCRRGALSVEAAVERPCPDQLALIGGGRREGRGTSDEAKLAGEVRKVNIVQVQASFSCNGAIMY